MNTLWTFGDSFTEGHGMNGEIPEYINADRNSVWPVLLSNKLNFKLRNLGENGMTTGGIVGKILENIDKFNETDIIIIQSSTIGRFDIPSNDYRHDDLKLHPIRIHSNLLDINNTPYLKHFTKSEFKLIKSFFETFVIDGYYYNTSLHNLLNLCIYLHNSKIAKKIIYWNLSPITIDSKFIFKEVFDDMNVINPFYLDTNKKFNTKRDGWSVTFFKEKLTIKDDTNGKILDEHLSKYGHLLFSELLYSNIKNNKII